MRSRRVLVAVLLALMTLGLFACDPHETPQPSGTDDQGRPPPDTAGPPGTVRLGVGTNFQQQVDLHPPGTTYVVASGLHRGQRVRPHDGDTFIGEDGAVMSGARVLDDFERRDGAWVAVAQHQEGFVHGTTLPGRERVRHPEDLWIDGDLQRHVPTRQQLTEGTWHLDYDADEIWVGSDPREHSVETSVQNYAFLGPGVRDVQITNLVVERYANRAQRGAINGHETIDWVVRDVTARHNHSGGIGIGPGILIDGADVHDNGQIGIVGTAATAGTTSQPVVIRNTHIHRNGGIGFDWRWEGGGTKFKSADVGVLVSQTWIEANLGPGLWFDIDNRNVQARDNVLQDNTGPGLFYEISFAPALFEDNLIQGNGSDDHGVGLRISSSSGVTVRGNVLIGQPVGLALQQGNRGDSDIGGPRVLADLLVIDNTVAAELLVDIVGVGPGRLDKDLRFEGNTYVTGSDPPRFSISGTDFHLSEWLQFGPERERVEDGPFPAPESMSAARETYGAGGADERGS